MRLGIDLDNTIIDYRKVFESVARELGFCEAEVNRSKNELRDSIRELEDGELKWQQLQAQVYGPRLGQAKVMEGFAEFLKQSLACGHDIYILSHKTQYAAQDKDRSCDLREAAIGWLKHQGMVSTCYQSIPAEHILFFDDRSHKIADITRLRCDIFVDDLPEIFEDPNFPDWTISVLIGLPESEGEALGVKSFPDWKGISKHMCETYPVDFWVSRLSHSQNLSNPRFLTKEGGLNSRGCKVIDSEGNSYYFKKYRDDHRNRRENESETLQLLGGFGFKNVPSLVSSDELSNASVFTWIEGRDLLPDEVNEGHIEAFVDFFQKLQKSPVTENWDHDAHASEACFSLKQLVSNLNERHKRLTEVSINDEMDQSFADWVDEKLTSLKQDLVHNALEAYQAQDFYSTDLLPQSKRILSPSDFGFHNCLVIENDKLCFLDFEYFGWDDPVKTLIDFLLHPHEKMRISETLKAHFNSEFRKRCVDDSGFDFRFEVFFPLYALKWVYIQSNIFLRKGESKEDRLTQFQKIQSFVQKHMSARSASI